jgi:hypothetical protein
VADAADAKLASGPNYGAAMEVGRQVIDQWTRGIFDYGDELGRFAVTRLNQQMETCREFANCRSVGDAVTCEWTFLQKAWADYSTQAAKQFQFWTTLAENVMAIGPAIALAAHPQAKAGKTWKVGPSPVAPAQERRPSASEEKTFTSQAAAR